MILDGHIHISEGREDHRDFARRLKKAGVDGGIIISLPPAAFPALANKRPSSERLDNLFAWTESNPDLYPFYWIDPTESDAVNQVDLATNRGVKGFKVICNNFFCGDERVFPVFEAIAQAGRPILFHSGILWDGMASSSYNRPAQFEALLEIKGLKFSLAHISWPWHDECIAVYGKFLNAHKLRPQLSAEMFIDITPGTPEIYRREALSKLFTVGYTIENNVIFGSDCNVNNYDDKWTIQWINRDNKIYNELRLSKETINKIYRENLKHFVGISG